MDQYFTTAYSPTEIVELRKSAFHYRHQDRVRLDGLDWNRTDQNSMHFSIRSQFQLISTLRVTFYQTLEKFNKATQIPISNFGKSPYILLARAATHPEYSNYDLHAKIRIISLEYCLENKIETVFGSLQKKSNRLNSLLQAGYEIISTQPYWPDSYLKNDGDVVLIALTSAQKIQNFIHSERNRLKWFEKQDLSNLKPILYL